MASAVLEALRLQVEKNTQVEASAVTLINGFATRLQAAVDAALANGATAAELAPVTDEIAAMNNSADALAAAITANTPATP